LSLLTTGITTTLLSLCTTDFHLLLVLLLIPFPAIAFTGLLWKRVRKFRNTPSGL
jgi:hypothetical protein